MKLLYFHRYKCSACQAKEPRVVRLAEEHSANLVLWDVDDVDGLAEAAFAGVSFSGALPYMVLTDGDDEIWRGESVLELKGVLENARK